MSWLGARHLALDRCGSTNDEAARQAARGAPHGTVVTARAQDAGRGRRGRSWHSPDEGNLYLSCVLRPDLPPARVPPITLAAGVAVCDAVNAAGCRSSLEWPNDVLIGRKKVAGILTEMSTREGRVDHVVLGIGVNLDTTAFPDELSALATSVRIEQGAPVDRERFVDGLLARLEVWLDRFFAGGVPAVSDAWLERAAPGLVRVDIDGRPIEGTPCGLDGDGSLLLRDRAGGRHRVVAGDVWLLDRGLA